MNTVPTDFRKVALIPQALRGEVAVIDLDAKADERVIDFNRTIPGATHLTVGEKPTGISVGHDKPRHVYLSTFGSRTVQSIDTNALVRGEFDAVPTLPTRSLSGGAADVAVTPDGRFV
ncbi:MAG: hypothetical protein R3A47_07950 [Polyangiales bacterium]